MKLFNIKINHFGGHNLPERPFSLFRPEFNDSLPLLPIEKTKRRKIKLGVKIYYLKIQETNHLISKKYKELK
jgi:hypothetical protein